MRRGRVFFLHADLHFTSAIKAEGVNACGIAKSLAMPNFLSKNMRELANSYGYLSVS